MNQITITDSGTIANVFEPVEAPKEARLVRLGRRTDPLADGFIKPIKE
jgi:hypothetical protein